MEERNFKIMGKPTNDEPKGPKFNKRWEGVETNQAIVDEAKRLANLDLGSLGLPYTFEKGLLVYFKKSGIDLEKNYNEYVKETFAEGIEKHTKELNNKNEAVKKILIENFFVEYTAPIYKKVSEVWKGRNDEGFMLVDEEKPIRLGWDKTIKHTYLGSELKVRIKDYVNELPLFECWHEKANVIISNLERDYADKKLCVGYLVDIKAIPNRTDKIFITIRKNEPNKE